MSVLDAILDTLTEDAPVSDVRVCVFWTAVVLESRPVRCGLASTLNFGHQPGGTFVPESGDLLKYSARQLAELVRSRRPLEAGIGMAAINALLDVEGAQFNCALTEVNARELILERGRGKNVVVVGHFPFVRNIQDIAATCWVLEQRPHPGDLDAGRADEVLPRADVVALTGTSIMNHTFEALMELCSPEAYVVALGPSTPLSPVLFDYGVDVIAGAQVVDIERTLRYISQGATFKQVKGVKLLSMSKQTR